MIEKWIKTSMIRSAPAAFVDGTSLGPQQVFISTRRVLLSKIYNKNTLLHAVLRFFLLAIVEIDLLLFCFFIMAVTEFGSIPLNQTEPFNGANPKRNSVKKPVEPRHRNSLNQMRMNEKSRRVSERERERERERKRKRENGIDRAKKVRHIDIKIVKERFTFVNPLYCFIFVAFCFYHWSD